MLDQLSTRKTVPRPARSFMNSDVPSQRMFRGDAPENASPGTFSSNDAASMSIVVIAKAQLLMWSWIRIWASHILNMLQMLMAINTN